MEPDLSCVGIRTIMMKVVCDAPIVGFAPHWKEWCVQAISVESALYNDFSEVILGILTIPYDVLAYVKKHTPKTLSMMAMKDGANGK